MTARKLQPQKFYNNMPLHFPPTPSKIVIVRELPKLVASQRQGRPQPAADIVALRRAVSCRRFCFSVPEAKKILIGTVAQIETDLSYRNKKRKQFSNRNKIGRFQFAVL